MRRNLISWIALVVSFATLCLCLFRCEPIEANWMAILIGILSLLTTSLITWQIYRTIELERTIKHFDRIVNSRLNVIVHDINHIVSAFEHRMSSYCPTIQPESQEKSMMYLMMALEEVLQVKTPAANLNSINKIMADILELIEKYKDGAALQLSKEEERRYLSIIRKIEHKDTEFLLDYISHAHKGLDPL